MISKTSLNNMVHKLHLDGFIESQKELLRDNRRGFLIPTSAKIKDCEYGRYRHLPINWEIPPITKDHLPEEFSQKAVNTVDVFRRKTYDLKRECIIYYDEEPVMVTRDSGYSKLKLISPENRKKARERVLNPDTVTGKYRLKKLFGEIGIVVIPERMTMWYPFTE